jgi:hyperosmotically inducible protein
MLMLNAGYKNVPSNTKRGSMIDKIRLLLLPLLLVAVVACNTQNTAPVQADNTARNASNPPVAQTPVDQAENLADLQISANIRKEILADDSLSSNAHNVKIITSGGTVTLRGR